jgi:hypothetical protein
MEKMGAQLDDESRPHGLRLTCHLDGEVLGLDEEEIPPPLSPLGLTWALSHSGQCTMPPRSACFAVSFASRSLLYTSALTRPFDETVSASIPASSAIAWRACALAATSVLLGRPRRFGSAPPGCSVICRAVMKQNSMICCESLETRSEFRAKREPLRAASYLA